MDLFLVFRFEHQHICCGSILVPPLFFLSLERAQAVGSLRSYHQVVFLFETESVRAHVCEALAGLPCNGLSGHPPPSCASLSCCALSISWHFLGFASRIKPSSPPGHVKTPHKENNERAMGPCALPLCPVHGAAYLPPGGTWSPAAENPSAPKQWPNCTFLAPNKMKTRINFLLSLTFFFQTSAHSILRLPCHHSYRPRVYFSICPWLWVCLLYVSFPHLRSDRAPWAPTALPSVLLACLSSSFRSGWAGISRSELLVGFKPHLHCICQGSPSRTPYSSTIGILPLTHMFPSTHMGLWVLFYRQPLLP